MTPALRQRLPESWESPTPEDGWETQAALAPAWQACRAITRSHATSFFFASFPLPKAKKQAAFAVYALCRWLDDRIDEAEEGQRPPGRRELMATVDAIQDGSSDLPFAPAVAEVNRQYAIPRNFWEDLIEGVTMDRQAVIIQTVEEMEIYSYHVASVVGLMMSKVFGLSDPGGVPHAVSMGLAMQLTNILRDVQEDFDRGRIYLPISEMRAHRTGPEAIAARRVGDPDWTRFIQFQIQRARDYYRSGEAGLTYLPNDGSRFTTLLMSRVYGGILAEIERNQYDVLSARRYVPLTRKLLIALRAWAGKGRINPEISPT